jgi:hypothetical protein
MSNISKLVNNIGQTVKSFFNNFKFDPFDETKVDRSNWMKSLPYSFSVFGEAGSITTFTLPVNPSEISKTLLPSIRITKTQGGAVVNHSGIKYGDLVIAGSTGLTPYKGVSGVRRSTGEAIFQATTGAADDKYKSGYEIFRNLESWFRNYYKSKSSGVTSGLNHRLVFQNYKDGEFLIVELLEFNMERSSAKPFHYDYNLKFKILGRETFKRIEDTDLLSRIDNALDRASEVIDLARGGILRFREILRQIDSQFQSVILDPLRRMSIALKFDRNKPLNLADVGSDTIKNQVGSGTASAILDSFVETFDSPTSQVETSIATSERLQRKLAEIKKGVSKNQAKTALLGLDEILLELPTDQLPPAAIAALEKDTQDSLDLPKSFYRNTLTNLKRIRDNASDFMGLSSSGYNELYERTQTFNITKTPTDDEYSLLKAFQDAILGVSLVLSSVDLFKSTYDSQIARILDHFNNDLPLQAKIATKEIVMPSTSLEKLAQKELGNSVRWVEIAELNGLKSPYVVINNRLNPETTLKLKSKFYQNPLDITDLQENDRHIVNDTLAVGAWIGQENKIATYKGGVISDPSSWIFYSPSTNLVVYVEDIEEYWEWKVVTTEWVEYTSINYKNVVSPGQKILIPVDPVFGFSDIAAIDDLPIYNGMSDLEKYFGIDLALDENFDLIFENGDLALVKGVDNVSQALRLLLSHDKGDLIKHPEIGSGIQIGKKVPRLDDVRSSIYQSLIQDPRIEDILNVEMLNVNNYLEISFQVKLKNIDVPVPLRIQI